jgi:aminopeptidase N
LDSVAGLAEAKRQMKTKSKGDLAQAISGVLIEFGTDADYDFVADSYGKMPLSQTKFGATISFAKYLAKIKDTDKVKKGVDMIVEFRDAIPAAYRVQTDPPINNMILGNLQKQKETDGLKDQATYIKSKIPVE